jgi:hypothetical protein
MRPIRYTTQMHSRSVHEHGGEDGVSHSGRGPGPCGIEWDGGVRGSKALQRV